MVSMLLMIPFPGIAPMTEIGETTVITSVVSHAFVGFKTAAIVVAENNPDGEAIFISGNLPGRPEGKLNGATELHRGDRVEIRGMLSPLLFEPGLIVSEMTRLGHTNLPPAKLLTIGALNTASMNNRRVRIHGILTSAKPRVTEWGGHLTLLTVADREGEIAVRLSREVANDTTPLDTDYTQLIGSEVEVEGVCMASFNSRREFLHTEIESRGENLVRILPGPPAKPHALSDAGLLGYAVPQKPLALITLTGTVTLTRPGDSGFILQTDDHAYAVYPEDSATLPSPGTAVAVTGFPFRQDHCGALHHATITPAPAPIPQPKPLPIDLADLANIEEGAYWMAEDYYHRLVTIKGRVGSVRTIGDGLQFELSASGKSCRVRLSGGASLALKSQLDDSPLVELTGVLALKLSRSSVSIRYLSVAEVVLDLRTPDDIVILPDSSYRINRLKRSFATLAPALLLLSLAGVTFLLFRRRSEKSRAKAIASDRKRIAAELHDTISQYLAGVKMVLDNFIHSAPQLDPNQHEALAAAGEMLDLSRREIRNAIHDLHSDELMEKSLGELLRLFAERLQAANPSLAISVKTETLSNRIIPETKRALLAVVQEATANAIRHGKATEISIELYQLGRHSFETSISDNGIPFAPNQALGTESGHYGLDNMRERAEHGHFTIHRKMANGRNRLIMKGLTK